MDEYPGGAAGGRAPLRRGMRRRRARRGIARRRAAAARPTRRARRARSSATAAPPRTRGGGGFSGGVAVFEWRDEGWKAGDAAGPGPGARGRGQRRVVGARRRGPRLPADVRRDQGPVGWRRWGYTGGRPRPKKREKDNLPGCVRGEPPTENKNGPLTAVGRGADGRYAPNSPPPQSTTRAAVGGRPTGVARCPSPISPLAPLGRVLGGRCLSPSEALPLPCPPTPHPRKRLGSRLVAPARWGAGAPQAALTPRAAAPARTSRRGTAPRQTTAAWRSRQCPAPPARTARACTRRCA